VILNWHIHRNHTIIPKTANLARLEENIDVYSLKLSEEEYDSITKLDKAARNYDP